MPAKQAYGGEGLISGKDTWALSLFIFMTFSGEMANEDFVFPFYVPCTIHAAGHL